MYKKYLVSLFAIALPLGLFAQVQSMPASKKNIEKNFADNAAISAKLEASKSANDIDAEVFAKIKGFNLQQEIKNIKTETKIEKLPKSTAAFGQRRQIRKAVYSWSAADKEKAEKTDLLKDINTQVKSLPSKYTVVKGADNKNLFLAKLNLSLAYVKVGEYKNAKNMLETI